MTKNPKYIEEKEILNSGLSGQKLLLVVLGSKSPTFNFNKQLVGQMQQDNISILFFNKSALDSFVLNDQRWNRIKFNSINHTGRNDDDLIFQFSEDVTTGISQQLNFKSDKKVEKDFILTKKTAILQTASQIAFILRTGIVILEKFKKNNYDKVLLKGKNLYIVNVLHELLNLNKCENSILYSDDFSKNVMRKFKNKIKETDLEYLIRIPQKNSSITNEKKKLSKKITQNDIIFFLNIKDNSYFSNGTFLVSKLKNKHFLVVDKSITKKNKDHFSSKSNRKVKFHNLTNRYFFQSRNQACRFKNIFIDSFNNFKNFDCRYGRIKLGKAFKIHLLNSFMKESIKSIYYLRLFRSTFTLCPPKALLVSPSRTLEARCAITAANLLKIQTFDLQSGTIAASHRYWPTNAQHLFCIDLLSKKIFIDFFKIPAKKIHLVGSPALDKSGELYKKQSNNYKNKKNHIFLALQSLAPEVNLAMVNTTLKAVSEVDVSEIGVGFHPGDSLHSVQYVKKNIKDCPINIKYFHGISLSDLRNYDICITYFSLLGLEAFCIGLDVIALNITKGEWPFRLSQIGIASEAYNSKELSKMLIDLNSKKQLFLRRINLKNKYSAKLRDGKASMRIDNIIDKYIFINKLENKIKKFFKK